MAKATKEESKKINVMIAEDHTLFAKLVNSMLDDEADIKVVGIASNGEEVIEKLSENVVDILLLDINMPKIDGIQLIGKLVKEFRGLKIIMLSSHTEAWVIQKALKSGAKGYLTKFVESEEVIEAIYAVNNGETYFCKTSLNSIMKNLVNKEHSSTNDKQLRALSKREKEVLQLIAQELTTSEIAEKLCISFRTVESHRKNLLHKLSAKNTVGLIRTAMEANLLDENRNIIGE